MWLKLLEFLSRVNAKTNKECVPGVNAEHPKKLKEQVWCQVKKTTTVLELTEHVCYVIVPKINPNPNIVPKKQKNQKGSSSLHLSTRIRNIRLAE